MPIGGFDNLKDSGGMNEGWRHVELREQADIHRRTHHQQRSFRTERRRRHRTLAQEVGPAKAILIRIRNRLHLR